MASYLGLLPNSEARRRIRRALALDRVSGAEHHIHFVRAWYEVEEAVRMEPWNVLLMDPSTSERPGPPELDSLLGRFPSLSVVAYLDPREASGELMLHLNRDGVRALVLFGIDDDPVVLRKTLTSVLFLHTLEGLRDLLEGRLHGLLHALVRPLLQQSPRGLTVELLARRHYGACGRTLRRHLRDADLPPPSRLIGWCRVFHAVRLLADPGRSARSVADVLGFSSGSALCRSVKRYSGLPPSELLAHGGVDHLVDLLASELEEYSAHHA